MFYDFGIVYEDMGELEFVLSIFNDFLVFFVDYCDVSLKIVVLQI